MEKSMEYLNASDIDHVLAEMTYKILKAHKRAEYLALIGIHTRGVYVAQRIASKIHEIEGINIETGSIDITMYRDDWTRISNHPIVQATDIPFSVDGKTLILVDDVLFTGRTVRAAMDAVIDFGRPDRIELAVLIDRGFRELPIQADYVGKFIKTRRNETINVLMLEKDGIDSVVS
ncbi:MAG TPA: bifunctional pyr operon transcriptional regulator/uracil phosphoribosyltransferase PyrR [Desulfobacteraceae bacterium]|nr:bifunctional pyr operon transcriptional regulator/uracil phosphoribosyltransferase PyrR [Desulfobacteraceae bacterium]